MGIGLQCPVCGTERKPLPVNEYDCDICGFKNAYIRYFATTRGYEYWKDLAKKTKTEWKIKRKEQIISSMRFWVGSNTIAFAEINKKCITIILNNGKIQTEEDAIGFSASERNHVVLYDNGTVRVFGDDNSFGQKETGLWRDVQSVLAAPNCTYGVTKNGKVVFAGSLCNRNVLKWNNIRLLRASNESIIGLNKDGKVCMEIDYSSLGATIDAMNWSGIIDIATSRDCIIGLSDKGTVKFAGKKNDARRAVEDWKKISAIALDNAYAYGLTKEGKVLLAGSCKSFLDRGRAQSSQWENIVGISCNQAGIGAVNESGDLLFAGTITGDFSEMNEAWDNIVRDKITALA